MPLSMPVAGTLRSLSGYLVGGFVHSGRFPRLHHQILPPENLPWRFVMDWNRVEGNWKQVKGQVKEKWGKLTDDDLTALTAAAISSKARSKSATA